MSLSPRAVLDLARRVVREELRQVRGQVAGGVTRAVLSSLDTARGFMRATVSLRADEERADIEVLEPYGFTSAPPAGAEGLALQVGGDAAHHVVLALGSRTVRLQALATGEVAMYSQEGQSILLKVNGDVVVTPKAGRHILLGGDGATAAVALATLVQGRLDALMTAINAWAPVAMDGGAALKLALATWLAASNDVGASKVKAE